jgi:sucrose synthase
MSELIQAVLDSEERSDLRQFLSELRLSSEQRYFLRNDILSAFKTYCNKQQKTNSYYQFSHLGRLISYVQELILENGNTCLIVRPQIAHQEAYQIFEDLTVELITKQELLNLRDRHVGRSHPLDGNIPEIDFQSFYDYSPLIRDSKNIGRGVEFLNRYLSSKLFQDPHQWLEALFQFLSLHHFNGIQLLINERIKSQEQLSNQVKRALQITSDLRPNEPYEKFRFDLQTLGFEPGWGNTTSRVRETLGILDQLIDSPDHQSLETFLSSLPTIFRIVLVSPHGWFGQEGVLGRPDTGGQVVYVLDQANFSRLPWHLFHHYIPTASFLIYAKSLILLTVTGL